MTKLSTILDQIDAGSMLLPEFQRGYVWNRDQVRSLMRSLYRGYPVGALLVWETDASGQAVRGSWSVSGQKQLLLDGQQRVSTVYGIVRGRPPSFFEGDADAFAGLRFNVETEAFAFHRGARKDDPRWIDVTALFVDGPSSIYARLSTHPETRERFAEYVDRIARLRNVGERDLHVEAITGADKTVDVVVDVFNRVNSGGTKLSKGDLALARICSEWADARPTMRRNLARWADYGFSFGLDWLLRNVNAVATGRAAFAALDDVETSVFQDSLNATLHHIDHFLSELAIGRLGLDHDRVLMGRYAIPVIIRHLHNHGGRFRNGAEADRALYWYVYAALRGRFAGSPESALARDLEIVDSAGVDGLITALDRSRRGGLTVETQDFEGVGRGSRAYPLLYLLTRVRHARDLVSGHPLGQDAAAVQTHEIWSKQRLAAAGYPRAEVNQVANFAFLTPSSAVGLTGLDPADHLGTLDPAARRSQWIPEDPWLWRVENYREFLIARRELLTAAANELLDTMVVGVRPWERLEQLAVVTDGASADARAAQLRAVAEELAGMGFARPEFDAEIAAPRTGAVVAVAELFWRAGWQAGQGAPVALKLDPDDAELALLAELGIEVFTSADAVRAAAHRRRAEAAGEVEQPVVARQSHPDLAEPDLAAVGNPEPVPSPIESGPEAEFGEAMAGLIRGCEQQLHYEPGTLKAVVAEQGGLDAARQLLRAPAVSDAFVLLWERQRLDLSVEALVLHERFDAVFTEEERAVARDRLEEFGYSPGIDGLISQAG